MNFYIKKKLSVFILSCILITPSLVFAKIPDKPHGDLASDYDQFWFLYESETRPGQNYKMFRPFYSRFSEYETAYLQQTILFPVYYREETNYWYTWSVLFFFTGTSIQHPDTSEDEDFISPLFFWGGGETEKEKYWGFFPFYGQVRNKLAWSEINFYAFPIYANWQRKEYKAHTILWPFVMWGGSDVREEFRIFPFYSKKEHVGKYYQYTILWPFFQWGQKYMDKVEPIEYGVFFPFYSYKTSASGNMVSRGILWFPILGSLVGYGYDKKTSEVDYNFLFFLFQYGKNNDMDYRKLIFFPFYGQYEFASKKTLFITPFYFQLKTDSLHVKSEYNFLLPFVSVMKQYFPELDRSDRYLKIWPLIKYHKDTEGSVDWNALTLFPMRSDELEKTWDPIISLIEYKSLSNGEKRISFLFRLYSQHWSEDKFAVYIPLLTDYKSKGDDMEWKFMYGLLGYKKEEEKRTFQLFWFLDL
ncbi:hypothetical protein [Leptospira sp. GIMC2001]|uniref:hypothetical protein n=1 Tax=Leptospira sp. GIMC2001 TaxID=1513297 RepID=UPI00234AD4A3|nr:hypothetical protein [Leptospira sp. GIMC2001]WCL50948.1 hypothetical protein O4O04_09095 [Leptospira sp. GIMC2001]